MVDIGLAWVRPGPLTKPESGSISYLPNCRRNPARRDHHQPAHPSRTVEGGMVQRLGFALMENLVDEDGKILTSNLGEYKLPNVRDVPRHEILYVRDDNGQGPFQAKPIGEHGAIPTAAAVGNAVYDAIGVQIMDLSITPEKIFSVLQARRTAQKYSGARWGRFQI